MKINTDPMNMDALDYYAHRIVTCVKQNKVIICLYDLMLNTLINKILNVNIME